MSKPTTSFDAGEDDLPIPWIRWSDYPSTDKNNPDKPEIKVVELETFESKLSIAVKVLLKVKTKWVLRYLPLKSKNSPNSKLLRLWDQNVKNGRLKIGTVCTILTYKRQSKKTTWTVRDYEMLF